MLGDLGGDVVALGVNGSGGNGPATAMHDENVSASLSTVVASSKPVIASTP